MLKGAIMNALVGVIVLVVGLLVYDEIIASKQKRAMQSKPASVAE